VYFAGGWVVFVARISATQDYYQIRKSNKDCFGGTPKVRAGLALHEARALPGQKQTKILKCV